MFQTRLLTLFALLFSFALNIEAQTPFQEAAAFPQDIQELAARTRNATVQERAEQLGKLWQEGAFSAEEQEKIVSLCAVMKARNFNGIKQFYPFFHSLVAIAESDVFSDKTRGEYLAVIDTTLQEKGAPNMLANFFSGVAQFAQNKALYSYNKSGVFLEKGDYSFAFGREGEIPTGIDLAVDEVIAGSTPTESIPADTAETATAPPTGDGWGGTGDSGGDGWGDTGTTTDDGWGSTETADDGWGDPWGTDDGSGDDGWGSADEWSTGEDDGAWGFEETEVSDGDSFSTPEETTPAPKRDKPDPGQKPLLSRFAGNVPGVESRKPLAGPYLKLENADLRIESIYDTVRIENTSGGLLYSNDIFVGKGGKFDWEHAGLPRGTAFVTFDEYTFSVKKAEIKAQDALVSYEEKLINGDSVPGYFEYRSQRKVKGRLPSFPRFKSYYPDYEIKLGIEGVRHIGGFSLIGPKVTGSSFGQGVSMISVSKGDSVRFLAKSKFPFVITPSSITNKRAELIIYRDKEQKDSLYHRAVQMRYDVQSGVLRARKDNDSYKYARFQDSYHDMTILADYLKWDVTQDTFNISMLQGRGVVPAEIESVDRFDERRFDRLQGLARFHPLVMAYNFGRLVGQSEFSSVNMYDYFTKKYPEMRNTPYTTVASSLRRLDQEDYIRYYPDLHWVELKRRGILYARAKQLKNTPLNILKARGGKGMIDFDDIFMPSAAPGGKSITMKLDKKEMDVYGVDSVILKVSYQDTMLLRIKPVPDKPITVRENRSMKFDGKVIAKAFIYSGKDFEYSYEDHTVEMPQIDSISFRVVTDSGLVMLPNNIKSTAGFLYVDIPNNKSNLRYFPDYPAFKTTKQSKVTFAGREIMDGVYKDTANFRFVVDTFRVEGLGAADPRTKKFRGTFYSGGIMDLFIDSIGVREDGSLGFNHPVPEDGVSIYDGRAMLYNGTVKMDNSGLRSTFDEKAPQPDTTEIHYLAARLQSNDFLFLPDSLGVEANGERSVSNVVAPWDSLAPKQVFTRGRMIPGEMSGVSFPEATFNGYELRWRVRADSMNLLVKEEPFTLYQTEDLIGNGFTFRQRTDSVEQEAALVLRSDGLYGIGELLTDRAIIRTQKFDFKEKLFSGNETEFLITDPSHQIVEVSGQNVSFVYHLGERFVNISTEKGGESQFEFPKLQYKTSLAHAIWSIDNNTIAFRTDEEAALESQRFTSIHPEEEGLNFRAASGNYDLNEAKLRIQGVPVIEVLDSRVYPKDGSQVFIDAPNRMLPLEGSEVRIGYLTPKDSPLGDEPGSHVLTNANISIRSAKRFEGRGAYNYINDIGEQQQIELDSFEPTMIEKDMLSDSVLDLSIAEEKLIGFEGTLSSTEIEESDNFIVEEGKIFRGKMYVRAWKLKPDFEGETRIVLEPEGLWTTYNTENNQTEVQLGEGKKDAGVVGLFYSDNGRFFAKLNKPLQEKASAVMLAQGIVEVDMTRGVVQAFPKQKKMGETRMGNAMEYVPGAVAGGGDVYFEGDFALLEDGEKTVRVSGSGKGNVKANEYLMDVMIALEFDKPKETFKMMGENLEEYLADYRAAEDISYILKKNEPKLLHKIAEMTEDKEAENFKERYERGRSMPTALNNFGLVLSKVVLKWSKERNAFYSYGMIGISNAYKSTIDAQVPGYVEILSAKNPNGPAMNVYLEISSDNWYLFQYDGKDWYVQSSNTELNEMLQDNKANKDRFEFIEDPNARNAFISRFRGSYEDSSLETNYPEVGQGVR